MQESKVLKQFTKTSPLLTLQTTDTVVQILLCRLKGIYVSFIFCSLSALCKRLWCQATNSCLLTWCCGVLCTSNYMLSTFNFYRHLLRVSGCQKCWGSDPTQVLTWRQHMIPQFLSQQSSMCFWRAYASKSYCICSRDMTRETIFLYHLLAINSNFHYNGRNSLPGKRSQQACSLSGRPW